MLKRFLCHCTSVLPSRARLPIETTLASVMHTLNNWRLPSYIIQGQLAGEDCQGSLIYFGEPHQYLSWSAMLFVNAKPPKPLGQVLLPDILRLKGGLKMHNLVLCPVNPITEILFSRREWFIIPRHVDCVIDLRKPLKEIFCSRGIKEEIRRIRKFNYTFKVMQSEFELEEFFYEMLVPTVTRRHKELAYVSRFEDLKKKLKDGYLLGAYRNSKWVAAELVVREGSKTLRSANIGWRNGDVRLMRDRVSGALTFELINRAKNEGFEFLNLGNSLPFIDDGVLNFKLRWGAEPVMPGAGFESGKSIRTRGFVAAHFNLASKCGRAILHHNPVLEKHNGVMRAVGWDFPVRPTFKRLIERGFPWVDIAKT